VNSLQASVHVGYGPDAVTIKMTAFGQKQTDDFLTAKQTRSWSNNRVGCKAGAATLSGLIYLFIYTVK